MFESTTYLILWRERFGENHAKLERLCLPVTILQFSKATVSNIHTKQSVSVHVFN